jgi:zinc protease
MIEKRAAIGVRLIAAALFVLTFALASGTLTTRANAVEIQDITTPGGIRVWLVEDYTVPMVSVSFQFNGGASLDPVGKDGLAVLLSTMMDEGAGDLDTAALKAELEMRGIELGFSAGQDDLGGGMRSILAENKRAFELLAMVLNHPQFEAPSLERIRSGMVASLQRSLTRPEAIMSKRLRELLFADHAYGRPSRGTPQSIAAITRDDIIAHHKALMVRDNLVIGVVGAISASDLAPLIDLAFGPLPQSTSLPPVADFEPVFGVDETIDVPGPQTIVSLALPGLKRSDPQFFDAYVLTHILGGGAFSSRLYNEIREKRGLVYGVGADLATLKHSAYLGAGFATRPDQAAEALAIMRSQITRLADEGPSEAELEAARKYIIGSYAINNLDSSTKIADVLVGLQSENLGIDYIQTRAERINSVTLDKIKAIAHRLLGGRPTVVLVGPEQG